MIRNPIVCICTIVFLMQSTTANCQAQVVVDSVYFSLNAYVILYSIDNSPTRKGVVGIGNAVQPQVSAYVERDSSNFDKLEYIYDVTNGINAEQFLTEWSFSLQASISELASASPEWYDRIVKDQVKWSKSFGNTVGIAPDSTETGFSLESTGLPVIQNAFAKGYEYVKFVSEDEGAPGKIRPIVDSLQWINRHVSFHTVAPRQIQIPYNNIDFLDTLETYPQRSFDLGWITNSTLSSDLETRLQNAQSDLQSGDEVATATELSALLEVVEAENGIGLTSEAYALLKYNTEYLLDQLRSYTVLVLADGFQLAGLPLDVVHSNYDSVYTAIPLNQPPIWWDGASYVLENDMVTGHGYWIETDTSGTQPVIGTPVDTLEMSLAQGWHLFSGPSCDVAATAIQDPGGVIITGTLYAFDNGYVPADTIRQGLGYWMMTNASGQVTLDCSDSAAKTGIPVIVYEPNAVASFSEVVVRDASDSEQTLYLDGALPAGPSVSFSLPPLPPENFFDARFAEGSRLIENDTGLIQIQSSRYPVTVEFVRSSGTSSMLLEELVGGNVVATRSISTGESLEISNTAVTAFRIRTQ